MDEEEEKKFEMEENGEKEGKNTLDKEALCERLTRKTLIPLFLSKCVLQLPAIF